MATALHDAVREARDTWRANVTVADQRWALRQLHGLYDLLMLHRGELVGILRNETKQTDVSLERDLALVVEDIATHILKIKAETTAGNKKTSPSQDVSIYHQPCGVSLIISNSEQVLRHGIAALAASIAAHDTAILASSIPSQVFSILQRQAYQHLDISSVHIVSETVSASDIRAEDFDHILIIDDNHKPWSPILHHSHITIIPATQGPNLAIIDEFPLDLQSCTLEITHNIPPNTHPSSALHAVFVHETHAAQLVNTLSLTSPTDSPLEKEKRGVKLPGCELIAENMGVMDLALFGSDPETMLQKAREEEITLIIPSTSLDAMIDILRRIRFINAITVLNANEKVEGYVEAWTHSSIFSVGRLPFSSSSSSSSSSSAAAAAAAARRRTNFPQSRLPLFQKQTFMTPRTRVVNATPLVQGEIASASPVTIEEIRNQYENRIEKLEDEPPGGRVDFFVQVGYVVKGVASVLGVGVVAGLWFGGRAVRRSFL